MIYTIAEQQQVWLIDVSIIHSIFAELSLINSKNTFHFLECDLGVKNPMP